ncbi:ATP synthase F1 subunit delta [Pleomorphovibrio marinus]|uniref:ATP synthase F1 subunit delta n=1 Tax=Pleomorphovibrio marinus TaxID=2164132 RepID=UPI000E0C543A|nr:ATP synthase F1 subunit delta [Pleomorphovibrio marinus]
MSDFKVASRYAKSILELSIEKGVLENVHADMERLLEICKVSTEFSAVLKSPIVSSDKKLNVLNGVMGAGASEVTHTFIQLLSKKGREDVFPSIAREFLTQYNKHLGIQRAEIVTTFTIDDPLRKRFREIVTEISGKEKVDLEEKVNESLIGGFVLKIDDRQLDESLSSKLRILRLEFTENLYEKKF